MESFEISPELRESVKSIFKSVNTVCYAVKELSKEVAAESSNLEKRERKNQYNIEVNTQGKDNSKDNSKETNPDIALKILQSLSSLSSLSSIPSFSSVLNKESTETLKEVMKEISNVQSVIKNGSEYISSVVSNISNVNQKKEHQQDIADKSTIDVNGKEREKQFSDIYKTISKGIITGKIQQDEGISLLKKIEELKRSYETELNLLRDKNKEIEQERSSFQVSNRLSDSDSTLIKENSRKILELTASSLILLNKP
jgi:hypothetical protein